MIMDQASETSWQRADTDWLHQAKWGTMTHFLADTASSREAVTLTPDDWNRRIDAVNVDRLAQQIAETGAGYHIFTLGQNSGFYCAPNPTYDAIVGGPSRCSERDLLGDLASALQTRGVRTIAYAPSHAPAQHRQAVEALKFTPRWDFSSTGIVPGSYLSSPDVDDRLSQALTQWEAVLRDWSVRWGERVHGWWIDGCYRADKLYNHPDAPNFRSLAQALKAGNPAALVAFNGGVKMPVVRWSEYDDYTAGEVDELAVGNKWRVMSRFVNGAQLHLLTYLGEYWGMGPGRFPDELAVGYTKFIVAHDGVVTWDIPISPDGQIPEAFLAQLRKIGASLS